MQKLILLAFLIPLTFGITTAQNLLSTNWKFQKGDEVTFSNINYDASKWMNIVPGKIWEQQGMDGYDGFAWYRLEVVVPKTLKKETKENGGLLLYLGKVDDADETFWNGKLIGATGEMPPNYQGAYATPRKYKIPFDDINFGEKHLLAVRVYDHGGGGGIYGEDIYLGLPGMKDLLVIEWAGKSDQILKDGKDIDLSFNIINKSKKKVEGELRLEIENSFGKSFGKHRVAAKIKKYSNAKFSLDKIDLPPGFYPSILTFNNESEELKKQIVLGVEPTNIISPTDQPENFKDYWRRAKKELAAVDPQFKLTKLEDHSKEKVDVFLLEMRSLGNVLVRGFYSRPKVDGVYPALLSVQGYGTSRTANDVYKDGDMVSLVLNIRGHGNSKDNIPGFPGYILNQIEDPEMYIYRGAYMDCIRAVDFLFEQKEVDQSRVAVEGGSQGGALSFATAALDNERIMACAPDVPFLSDFRDYFAIAPWPGGEAFNYLKEHPHFTEEAMYHTLSYIDIKNLAQDIKAPVFMGFGMLDMVCPPHINFAAYNEVTTKKSYVAYPNAGHGLPGEHYTAKMKWLKKQFGLR